MIRSPVRCNYDAPTAGMSFDNEEGFTRCPHIAQIAKRCSTGTPKGEAVLGDIIEAIQREGRGGEYNCVAVVGGPESSFLLMKAVDWRLRQLAARFDNTWICSIVTGNIPKAIAALGCFLILANANPVPMHFCLKYCFPVAPR